MKNYKEEKTTVIYTVQILINKICDKCGCIIKQDDCDAYDSSWFELTKGKYFPDSWDKQIYFMDLCENCSNEIIFLLEQNGFNLQKRDDEG